MSAKKQASTGKRNQQLQGTQKFLWHLLPTWRDKFSHKHWWKPHTNRPEDGAVVWEILRRHPRAETLLNKSGLTFFSSDIEQLIAYHGDLSWPELGSKSKKLQNYWNAALCELPPQHGVFTESNSNVATLIGGSEEAEKIKVLGKRYWASIPTGPPFAIDDLKTAQKVWNESSATIGQVRGNGVNWEAFKCLSLGGVLIGFDPNYPKIENLVFKKVIEIAKAEKRKSGIRNTAGRLFWQEWLDNISKFEKEELSRDKKTKADDQLFYKYRKVIKDWKWPT